MQKSVLCVGELLIDFFCTDIDTDLTEGLHFSKRAGGAPANVAAAISRLGGKALFSGKVGQDPFGHFLKTTLERVSVDTTLLIMDAEAPTTLAFVSLKANGERDFVFHRGADAFLRKEEVDEETVRETGLLHFGSATALLSDPFCKTYFELMEDGLKRGQFISFDPNFRADLWRGTEALFIERSQKAISYSDFVKVSEDELTLLTGAEVRLEGVKLLHDLGAQFVAVTLGKEGTLISNGESIEMIPSISVHSIDSTGAGDAFVGATLYQLSKEPDPKAILTDFEEIKKIIRFANKVGALVCTKVGAIDALPTSEEVETLAL